MKHIALGAGPGGLRHVPSATTCDVTTTLTAWADVGATSEMIVGMASNVPTPRLFASSRLDITALPGRVTLTSSRWAFSSLSSVYQINSSADRRSHLVPEQACHLGDCRLSIAVSPDKSRCLIQTERLVSSEIIDQCLIWNLLNCQICGSRQCGLGVLHIHIPNSKGGLKISPNRGEC